MGPPGRGTENGIARRTETVDAPLAAADDKVSAERTMNANG